MKLIGSIGHKAVRLATHIPGSTGLVRRLRAKSIAIAMYHGVVSQPLPLFNWCQIERRRFEEHIEFLSTEYRVLRLREIVDRLSNGLSLPEKTAVITFDDGFRSVQTNAFPILERYQTPFTVFLITGMVGTDQLPWPERLFSSLVETRKAKVEFDDKAWPLATLQEKGKAFDAIFSALKKVSSEKKNMEMDRLIAHLGTAAALASDFALMSWAEIQQLSRTGLADFGSHTHTHPILSRCTPEQQRWELQTSRDVLREQLGGSDLFAYPNGTKADFTDATKAILKKLDYRSAVTTIPGLNARGNDLFELRRVNVGANTTVRELTLLMMGL